ncbi:MAG: PAS domain-containing protein [Polyangia bacterium]
MTGAGAPGEALRRLVESYAQALWEASADGELVVDSPSWRSRTGQSFEEWRGAGWLAAVHPDDRADAERTWREAVAAGYIIDVTLRQRQAEGGWRWTRLWATPLRGANGAVVRYAGMSIDIHPGRQSEDRLRRGEERQAFLLALSDALRPLADPLEIQEVATRLLGEHLQASRVGYAEDQADDETIVVTRHYTDGVPGIEGRYRYDDYGPALLREFRAGRTVVRPDVANDPTLTEAERRAHEALQLGATVNVPLVKGGRLLAVLFLHYREAHAFSGAELQLLLDVAERTWAAVERARAEAALRQANDELERRVAERTAELSHAVQQLWAEAREREAAELARNELRRQLDTAHEDERRRIARDLHDQTGQLLAELQLAVHTVAAASPLSPAATERLTDLQRVAAELGRQVHDLAVRLRPTALDDVGLTAALRELTTGFTARTHVPVDLEAPDPKELGLERLPPEVETVVYRVVQEALTNIAKHAAARQVSVVVTHKDGAARVIVEDDGRGFEPGQAGAGRLGLVGMRERVTLIGGELEIESEVGRGTCLIARLPLRREAGR